MLARDGATPGLGRTHSVHCGGTVGATVDHAQADRTNSASLVIDRVIMSVDAVAP